MAGRPVLCDEFTMAKFEDSNALNFVALQLILDWGRPGAFGHQSPILKRDVQAVGINLTAHRISGNVI